MNRKIQWVMPVVILVAASGVSWWSAKQKSAVEQHVRNEVIQLIPLVRNNPAVIGRMVINQALCSPVENSLSAISSVWSGNRKDLLVTVTTGDDPNYGDGTATHVALVDVGNLPTVGLRIVCGGADEPVFIAGVWTQ